MTEAQTTKKGITVIVLHKIQLRRYARAAGLFSLAAIASAGDIDPPAGPVAPTMKKLSEVEPRIAVNAENTPGDADSMFKISQPGSYYLTGNVVALPGKSGIEIDSIDVTIDLGGFRVGGYPGSLHGITTVGRRDGITIANGTFFGFGQNGVSLDSSGGRVCDVHARGNGGAGIFAGTNAIVRSCTAIGNGVGISAWDGAVIQNCTASDNNVDGISAGNGATVSDCLVAGNGASGVFGGNSCNVRGCIARGNDDSGIRVAAFARVADCSTETNGLDGIGAGYGSTVSDCASGNNDYSGISTGYTSLITNCTVSNNGWHGITAGSQSTIRGNVANFNGDSLADGAGIFVDTAGCRIEGNTCHGSDFGIRITSSSCVVLRNTCSGNTTNWNIAAWNIVAPILFGSSNASPINGNVYSGNMGSTDPNANFSH